MSSLARYPACSGSPEQLYISLLPVLVGEIMLDVRIEESVPVSPEGNLNVHLCFRQLLTLPSFFFSSSGLLPSGGLLFRPGGPQAEGEGR